MEGEMGMMMGVASMMAMVVSAKEVEY